MYAAAWSTRKIMFAKPMAWSPTIGCLCVPDGYVGAFIAADRMEALRAYLQRVGICPGMQ
jgi:hypothetical protein